MNLNRFQKRLFLLCIGLVGIATISFAQETPSNQWEARIRQAQKFDWDSLSSKVFQLKVEPRWFTDHTGFAYETETRDGRQFYVVSFSSAKKEDAFNREQLAEKLESITGKEVDYKKLSLANQQWKNRNEFSFQWRNKKFTYKIAGNKLIKEESVQKDEDVSKSPDGEYTVFIKDYNLYKVEKSTGDTTALSRDGKKDYIYGSSYGWDQVMKGENAIPKPNLNISWSPDSKKILTQIMDTRGAEKMYLLNWSIDSLYRPQLLSYFRGSPGDTTVVHYIPIIYDMSTEESIPVKVDPIPHFMDDLAGYGLKWAKDSRSLLGTFNQRGYKQKDVIRVDATSGKVQSLYTDTSSTNIDYLTRFKIVSDKNIAFITSERTGWKQLYKIDLETDRLTPITAGKFVVKDIAGIDSKKERLYFTASGREEGVNPYFDLLYRIDFDGKNLKVLTKEPINHEISISDDYKYFVDNQSTAQESTRSLLRRTKEGSIVMEIDRADVKDLEAMGWQPPQEFTTLAKDGKTKIYGALWKPTDFDEHKSYPIVDYTYTGPHMNVFPNTFRKGIYGLYDSSQALAELGFIVMQVDGRGSSGRSKEFHDKSYKNLGNNLEDHAAAIHYLADRYSWIDGERVGIFGHSFGGYDAAHALLAFNDTYKVAVSESGDHDWRMEKAWYPEFYAGWPVDETYDEQSNITMAPKLKGKLLLIHGGIDENVNPSATFKLSEALIKARKYFDLLIVPSGHHPIPKEYYPYVQQKRWRFFVDHLITDFRE